MRYHSGILWETCRLLFKKTAKVLLIESDQGCQIADINFFLVMVADVSDCGFYGLDPVVIRFFSLGKKLAIGKICKNI